MPKKLSTKRNPPVPASVPVPHVSVLEDLEPRAWVDVEDDLPDGESTVMIYAPLAIERVWLGFWDGEVWRDVNGQSLDGVDGPTHWRDLPAGPIESGVRR